jgi:phosphoserine phosphatase
MIVAFDVDGTLIDFEDKPRYDIIDLLRWFYLNLHELGTEDKLIIWSGGGIEYTKHWVKKLGLENYISDILEKCSIDVDIAVDDAMDTENWGNEHKCKVVIKV